MTDLEILIADFGAYRCYFCRNGNHDQCCGWGGNYSDECTCQKYKHDWELSERESLFEGIQKLRVLKH